MRTPPDTLRGASISLETGIRDALAEAALLAVGLAARKCGPFCRDHHAGAALLRVFRVAVPMEAAMVFVAEQVRLTIERGGRHILIAGVSDCLVLAAVEMGIRLAGCEMHSVRLKLIHECSTVLDMNAAYALERGLRLSCSQGRAQRFETSSKFNLVISDGLLAQRSTETQKKTALQTRRALLAPEGVYAAVEYIDLAPIGEKRRGEVEAKAVLSQQVRENWEMSEHRDLIELDTLMEIAHRSIPYSSPLPRRSATFLEPLLAEAGFMDVTLSRPKNRNDLCAHRAMQESLLVAARVG